jgi:hypothetical protein
MKLREYANAILALPQDQLEKELKDVPICQYGEHLIAAHSATEPRLWNGREWKVIKYLIGTN